ncbi:hypothetical protein [Streptomyces sp. NPDC002587]
MMSDQLLQPGTRSVRGRRILGIAPLRLVAATATAVGAFTGYRRTARLPEVEVAVPQLSELTFAVNNASHQVARQMVAETVTRVPGGQPVEYLAIAMPNRGRRPFQPQGHYWSKGFEQARPGSPESDGADDASCRAELQRVQRGVRAYAVGFARPAGVREAESTIGRIPAPRAPDDRSERSGSPAANSTRDPR